MFKKAIIQQHFSDLFISKSKVLIKLSIQYWQYCKIIQTCKDTLFGNPKTAKVSMPTGSFFFSADVVIDISVTSLSAYPISNYILSLLSFLQNIITWRHIKCHITIYISYSQTRFPRFIKCHYFFLSISKTYNFNTILLFYVSFPIW